MRKSVFIGSIAGDLGWSSVSAPDAAFSWLPFTIQQRGRKFRPDPAWSISGSRPTGKAYYVATDGSDANSGLDAAHPLRKINTAIGKADVVEVYVAAGVYGDTNGLWSSAVTKNISIMSYGGRAILGACREGLSWARQADPNALVFGATCGAISTVYDHKNLNAYGDASKLTAVADVATVQATPGSYVRVSTTLYVRTIDDRTPDADLRTVNGGVNVFSGAITVYLENIDFEGGADFTAAAGPASPTVYVNNCTFKYEPSNNVVDAIGATVYYLNCLASAGYKDGFAYAAGSGAVSYGVEINCIGRDNGTGGAHTNQGSTGHSGCCIVRVGGEYMRNDGPGVEEIDAATRSWNLGIYCHDSTLPTNPMNYRYTTSTMKVWLDKCRSSGATYDISASTGVTVYTRQFVGAATNTGAGTISEY